MGDGSGIARDPVSGLPNRLRFIEDKHTAPFRPATMVLVTLADARAFNEILRALGHARSEAFIRVGAARLRDVIGAAAEIYHVSVLNFVCVLPIEPGDAEPHVVDRIVRAFGQPLICDDIPIDTRIGVGLAALGDAPGACAEDLRAALAAAQDSRRRPEGWAWYDQRSDDAHKRGFRLLTDLKTALTRTDQLHLVFQPKVSLSTGACISAEALIRWRHRDFGLISPAEFIPLAEATALVTPLTRWVIAKAVAQIVEWDRAGLEMRLAVNISPKNLEAPDIVEYLLFVCATAGVDRGRLELEVTEGVNAAQGQLILDRLAALRRLGFGIDDFGAGYSNMGYLTRLSAQTLKIDQSLVRGVVQNSLAGQLLAGVVQMGRDLGYKVVAEGIETEAERALLTSLGCDFGRGYLFARPMTGDALFDWTAAAAAPRLLQA